MKTCIKISLFILILFSLSNPVAARTKLTTLPPREEVRIDLSSSNQGLVEEDRTINLVKGLNHVDFSWAGTYIMKDSIQIRTLKASGTVNILSISYPPGENALFWDVYSEKSGPAKFRITYLITGFKKRIDYLAMADRDEKHLSLEGRVNLANNTGENYQRADIQLGKQFTYKNREMLNRQVRKMLAFKEEQIPVRKKYVSRPYQGKEALFFYAFDNTSKDKDSFFGNELLEAGKTRVYIKDSERSETFLGEDWSQPTGVGQESLLYMGKAKDVKSEFFLYKNRREHMIQNRWYHDHQTGKWTLENFKKETVTLTIEKPMDGEWVMGTIVLKEEKGERNDKVERVISLDAVTVTREHNGLLTIDVKLPPTGKKKIKWNLYVDWTLRNRGF